MNEKPNQMDDDWGYLTQESTKYKPQNLAECLGSSRIYANDLWPLIHPDRSSWMGLPENEAFFSQFLAVSNQKSMNHHEPSKRSFTRQSHTLMESRGI